MRLLACALFAASTIPAQAQPSRAEALIEQARRSLAQGMAQGDCAQSTDPQEIIVCGRGQAPDGSAAYRVEPSEDDSPRSQAGGEQRFAMGIHDSRCTPEGRHQRCNGGLPILPMIFRAIEIIRYQTSHD
jgi:hypothetical protein